MRRIGAAGICAALVFIGQSIAWAAPPPPPAFPSGFFFGASLDGIYSYRNNAGGVLVTTLGAPTSLLNGQDLAFPDKGGVDARLGAGFGQWSVEGRFLGGFKWNSSIPAFASGNAQIGAFSNFGVNSLSPSARSSLDSWEANLRWQALPWLTPFVGYRQIKMSDETDINAVFNAFSALYTFSIPWQAKGVQIGANVRLLGPGTTWQPGPFFFDVDGRIGIYKVNADVLFNLIPSTGGSFPSGTTFSKSNSMIYELGATLGYQITPNWDVHVGYRLLSITDALFANDYAARATALATAAAAPDTRRFNLNMVTIGTRVMFP
jgi:opacity protein-like surface antigen